MRSESRFVPVTGRSFAIFVARPQAILRASSFAAAIVTGLLAGSQTFASDEAARSSVPAKGRESSFRRAAKAEAFKPIVADGDGATPLAESEATDDEIELIKRASREPTARPQPIVSRPVRGVTDRDASADEVDRRAPASEVREQKESSASEAESESSSGETAAPTEVAVRAKEKKDAKPGAMAETALRWLKNGNERYVKRRGRADGKGANDRKRLVDGQRPHALVLACSDSRVPPEIVFDQALGEISVVRVAGEALDSATIASVEHAIETYGSRLLVVLGHSRCDAVEAAMRSKDGDSSGSESLDKLLADIRPRLKQAKTERPSPNLEVEAALNADGVARDLLKRSSLLRRKVEDGDLTVKSGLYRLESGRVSFY